MPYDYNRTASGGDLFDRINEFMQETCDHLKTELGGVKSGFASTHTRFPSWKMVVARQEGEDVPSFVITVLLDKNGLTFEVFEFTPGSSMKRVSNGGVKSIEISPAHLAKTIAAGVASASYTYG